MAEIIDRQLEIRFPNGDRETITSNNIVAESMTITRSICDGNLKLGGCIASCFEIQLIGINPDTVQDKRIQVIAIETPLAGEILIPSDELSPSDGLTPGSSGRVLFTGTIDSAKRQQNRQIVNITAYDDLYTLGRKNVYTWFYQVCMYSPNITLSKLVEGLLTSQLPDLQYTNAWGRSMNNTNYLAELNLNRKNFEDNFSTLTASEILRSANELMGLFGYITAEGVYTTSQISGYSGYTPISIYESLIFEEYTTAQISECTFDYGSGKQASCSTTSRQNCYYSDDNVIMLSLASTTSNDELFAEFLVKRVAELGELFRANTYSYRPFTLKIDDSLLTNGDNLLGKKLRIATGETDLPYIFSFVCSDKMTGILALKHELSAQGDYLLQGE